ncbi:unnamed protein product, partial [Nesidiocoris tenuis]
PPNKNTVDGRAFGLLSAIACPTASLTTPNTSIYSQSVSCYTAQSKPRSPSTINSPRAFLLDGILEVESSWNTGFEARSFKTGSIHVFPKLTFFHFPKFITHSITLQRLTDQIRLNPDLVRGDEDDNSPVQVEINPLISKAKKIIQFRRDTRFKRGDEQNAKKPSLFLEFPESFFSDPKLMKLYTSLTGGADSNSNEPQITKLAFQIDPSRLGDATRRKRKARSDTPGVMSRSRRQRLANHFAQSVDSKFRSWSDKIDSEVAQMSSSISKPAIHHAKHGSPLSRVRAGTFAPCAPSCPTTCSTTRTTTCPTTTPSTCKTTTTCPTTCKTTTTSPTTCSTTTTCKTTTTCPTTTRTTTCPTTCSTTTTCPTPSTCSTTCSTTRKITGCPRKNKPEESAKNFFGRFGHRSNIRKKRRYVRARKNHRVASRMRKRSARASNRDLDENVEK